MTTASVASLRSAPTMAVYGLTCVFLYIVPAIVFLLPRRWSPPSSRRAGPAASSAGSARALAALGLLADNGVYTGVVIVCVFWLGVLMSARGGTGGIAKLASSGLLIGTLIPGALLVVLAIVYLIQGNASAAPMDSSHLIPQWTGIASLVLIVNNFLSYSGMEMNSVHVSSLRNPRSEFPRAISCRWAWSC